MEDEKGLFIEKRVVLPITPVFRKLLRMLKVFPPEGQKMTKRQFMWVFSVGTFISIPISIGLWSYFYEAIKGNPGMEIFESVQHIVNSMNLYWDVLLTLPIADKLNDFLDENQTYRFGVPKTILRRRKMIRAWNYVFFFLLNVAGAGTAVVSMVGICEELIDKRNLHCELGLPLWYPFEIRNVFLKVYLHLTCALVACYYVNFLVCYTIYIPENVLIICARIRHLEKMIRLIRFKRGEAFDMGKLHFCIRCHREIVSFVKRSNDLFGHFLSRRYMLFIVMLSILEYEVYFKHSLNGFMMLFAWFTPAFLFCECGHLLGEEYGKLKWAIYGTNWYDMPPEVRKTFIVFLGSVQQPINLTAPPMFTFNRDAFLQIVKGSYSFLMYLRGFVDKN